MNKLLQQNDELWVLAINLASELRQMREHVVDMGTDEGSEGVLDADQALERFDSFKEGHIGTHVEYLTESTLASQNLSDYGFSVDGWYFWDETGSCMYGPFKTHRAAILSLAKYCKQLNARK